MLNNNATLNEVIEYQRETHNIISKTDNYTPNNRMVVEEWIKLQTNVEDLCKINFILANTLNNLTQTNNRY